MEELILLQVIPKYTSTGYKHKEESRTSGLDWGIVQHQDLLSERPYTWENPFSGTLSPMTTTTTYAKRVSARGRRKKREEKGGEDALGSTGTRCILLRGTIP